MFYSILSMVNKLLRVSNEEAIFVIIDFENLYKIQEILD